MTNEEAVYYLQYLRHNVQADSLYDVALVRAIEALKNAEFGEDEPVKCGHWEKEEDFIGEKHRCTMCRKVIRHDRAYVCQGELIFDFCPFCGADMRGEENDN